MRNLEISRRGFLGSVASGVAISVVPLSAVLADMQVGTVGQPPNWISGGRVRFRRDGIPKVTGEKVFAMDVRARDMPGWPDRQSHALLIRASRSDRVFEGLDLSVLGPDLQPDVLVTAADLARDGVAMVESDFYGPFLLDEGETPLLLGQPVALAIFHDYPRFRLAKRRLQFNQDAIRYGAEAAEQARAPYGAARFVRIGGATPDAEDAYSPLKNTIVFPDLDKEGVHWPTADQDGDAFAQAMHHADALRQKLDDAPEGWRIWRRTYRSQSVDPAAMEPDNGNAWFDAESGTLHVVTATQSPYTVAGHIAEMAKSSRFPFASLTFYPGYTVGYGQKEHHAHPYYVAMAALYGEGNPVRLALDRYEHFQTALKRHSFDIEATIALDEATGQFKVLAADLVGNGGGLMNFSPSVGTVAATAMQSVYYFPNSDLAVTVNASRAVTAGSMRGYGTLQSMTATEMMVDEIAQDLGVDAIELRRRNVLKSGMKNTQGAVPAGLLRADEILAEAEQDPLWTERDARKAAYEADNPGALYGVGFACVQKDYGTGAEAALVQIELRPDGHIHMKHVASEIGCGSTTAQMLVPAEHLGRPADTVDFAVVDWPSLPLNSTDEPYTTSQEDEDQKAEDPHWVPRITSPRSASNSAYYFSHATREAARLVFELGLWDAALSIWREGIGGGQAGPLTVRRDQAEWRDGLLAASGLEPLSLERLAARANEHGLVTGVTVHTFNRWAWATAEFEVDGQPVSAAIDALSVRWGDGASATKTARMTDAGYAFQPRRSVAYPPVQRNNASVVYYAPAAALVEVAVNTGNGEVSILSHKSWLECGSMIVPELVSGQIQGGTAMGIGHALYEDLPLYEDGPGNGTWNFNRYRLPRAADVAVWTQSERVLPPLSESDPPKGIAEVVMIPVVAATACAVHHATGHRFYELPLRSERILETLA
jgi:CO/xanthine dehydrogenase Mo-binding subunit